MVNGYKIGIWAFPEIWGRSFFAYQKYNTQIRKKEGNMKSTHISFLFLYQFLILKLILLYISILSFPTVSSNSFNISSVKYIPPQGFKSPSSII